MYVKMMLQYMKYFLLVLLVLLCGCFENKTEYRIIEKKLPKVEGEKYIFEYSGKVNFSKKASQNIQICITDKKHKKCYIGKVNDDLIYRRKTHRIRHKTAAL